jgi:hypothetical protein
MIAIESIPLKRRVGRFFVSRKILEDVIEGRSHDAVAAWCAMFGRCVILETKIVYPWGAIEYTAYCEDFEAHPDAEALVPPVYDVTISRREDVIAGQTIVTFDAKFTRLAA